MTTIDEKMLPLATKVLEESNSREACIPTFPPESTVCISQEGSENKGKVKVKKRRKKDTLRYLSIVFITSKVYHILEIFARVGVVFVGNGKRDPTPPSQKLKNNISTPGVETYLTFYFHKMLSF